MSNVGCMWKIDTSSSTEADSVNCAKEVKNHQHSHSSVFGQKINVNQTMSVTGGK